MDMEHGNETWTWSKDITAWTSNIKTWTWSTDILHGHAARTCSMDIQLGHAKLTSMIDKQPRKASSDIQHRDMDILQHGDMDML
jgi:hypothetical protein